jgi:hypothetical protein
MPLVACYKVTFTFTVLSGINEISIDKKGRHL